MKVTQPGAAKKRFARIPTLGSALRWAVLGLAFVPVLMAIVVMLRPDFVQRSVVSLERRWGYAFRNYDRALIDKWSIALGSYLREATDGVPEIPELVIDVPFKEMSKIYAKRSDALARGILVQGGDDFVKGEIRIEDATLPIKLRLKGDWNDHLVGRKWSFRIRVRDGEHLFGMRRFSIQNPNTRGFQSEMLFFEVLRQFDVMVPRYRFVDVSLNGDSMGVMALEEFFAKEMLEHNQRKEGVIVRFDESLVWDAKDAISGEDNGWGGAFDHFANATVDGIGSSSIAESPILTKQYAIAAGLMQGFVDGEMKASEVFDVRQLATFIAVADYFGSWHSVAWHNMRFYLNPITLRLEPIPFDATLQDKLEGEQSVMHDEPIVVQMLNDSLVWRAYTEVLQELRDKTLDGSIPSSLMALENEQLPILQSEFRMLGNYPLDYLLPRVESLLADAQAVSAVSGANPNLFVTFENERDEYPVFAHLGLLQNEAEAPQLQIDTAIPRDVVLTAVEWVSDADEQRISAIQKEILPIALSARGVGSAGARQYLQLAEPPQPEGWVLEVAAGLAGRDWVKTFRPGRIYPALQATPIPRGDVAGQLAIHRFLRLNTELARFEIGSGNWDVTASIIIPQGYSLKIEAGATLSFAADATLISYGMVELAGSAAAPVQLLPLNGESWPGMIVTGASGRSLLRHVVVRNTTGVSYGDWSLTGGVNFYVSDVEISNSQFLNSLGEDALNIIHSEFTLTEILIDGTASDAFDGDFATGIVSGSRFINVGRAGGGDAVDVSGSQITVVDSYFENVSDKALSVGERSEMDASGITIVNAGTGAAAKDGSVLRFSDSSVQGAAFAGLTAYIKKPEYGPAEVVAEKVSIENAETPVLVQTGSRVVVDGEAVPASDIDVDALYETVMRKGFR